MARLGLAWQGRARHGKAWTRGDASIGPLFLLGGTVTLVKEFVDYYRNLMQHSLYESSYEQVDGSILMAVENEGFDNLRCMEDISLVCRGHNLEKLK